MRQSASREDHYAQMRNAHRLAKLALAAVAAYAMTSASAQAAATKAEMSEIVAALPKTGFWQKAELQDGSSDSVYLLYSALPESRLIPKNDAASALQFILKSLVQKGHNLQRESITVFINAEQTGLTTISGKPGVRPLGSAHYDYNNDSFVWEP